MTHAKNVIKKNNQYMDEYTINSWMYTHIFSTHKRRNHIKFERNFFPLFVDSTEALSSKPHYVSDYISIQD